MVRIALLMMLVGTSALAQGFQTLDHIDEWLLERKVDVKQKPICRASIPGSGSWFSARIHLNSNDELVIPNDTNMPNQNSVQRIREALERCRKSILYL